LPSDNLIQNPWFRSATRPMTLHSGLQF
jgi:hypothetical protein